MHVAMVIDEERLRQEHTVLNRLAIGLIDHGFQLTRIVPDAIESEAVWRSEQRIALAPRIEAPFRVMPWMRRPRASRLKQLLDRNPPDVIYAVGHGAWPIALDLGRLLETPVALGIWRASLIRKAARQQRHAQINACIAPTQPIADALKSSVDPELVSLVPMGVAIPPEPRDILPSVQRSIGIAVIGSGKDLAAYEASLGGLSRIVREYPQTQIILELRGPHQHEIWQIAKKLDLLGFVSGIEDAAHHRTLLTCCDLLLVPERFGELSSVLLDGMASALSVVARDDPYLDMLIDEQTALLVHEVTPAAWATRISSLLSDPDHAIQLGRQAREYVRTNHPSRIQIDHLVDTLERIVSGNVIAFPGPTAR